MTLATYPDLLKRTVLLYRDEDGYFIVEVPNLNGYVSRSESREAAIPNSNP